MKRLFAVILLALVFLAGCGKADSVESADSPVENTDASPATPIETSDDTLAVGVEESDVFDIVTPYCTLKYPSKWKELVSVSFSDDPVYRVEFKVKDTGSLLFEVVFGECEGYQLGTVSTSSGDITVWIVDYTFEESDPCYDEYCAMQEDVNVIINRLSSEYGLKLGE